jgi:putative membrane protein
MRGLSEADKQRVADAVARAESLTDAEIVPMLAATSDDYRDVALNDAVLAMLLVAGAAAALPSLATRLIEPLTGGWDPPDPRLALTLLMVAEAIVFLVVRFAFSNVAARAAVAPTGTKRRRVRRRAISLFKVAVEARTEKRYGVLIYLSAVERMAEIVADEALHGTVAPETWGEAMAALVGPVKQGRVADGMIAAIERVGAVLAGQFPKTPGDTDELSNRLIEL